MYGQFLVVGAVKIVISNVVDISDRGAWSYNVSS